jgi:hypothetical protein
MACAEAHYAHASTAAVWLRDIDRLHTLLVTYGDDAMCEIRS